MFKKVMNRRVLVERDSEPIETVRKSGIVTLNSTNKYQKEFFKGTIKLVGENSESGLEVGDKIMFENRAPIEIEENVVLIREDEVLAVFE